MPKSRKVHADTPRTQFGALCWRVGKAGAEVLLITSRETGRWVIPKGWPMEGRTGHEAAAIEAWEEAGIKGEVGTAKLGDFTYDKILKRDTKQEMAQPCVVQVFPLEVSKVSNQFAEMRQRRRKWFAPEKAARKVVEDELKAILAGFAPDVPASPRPAPKQRAKRARARAAQA